MEKRNVPTFEEAARAVHQEVAPSLRNASNRVNWLRSLENHVFPVFGKKTVDTAIDSADVLRAILPIWRTKPDMARKTLARIRRVFDWATLHHHRDVMVGNITLALPNPCIGVRAALPGQPREGHHAALPYQELPELFQKIRMSPSGSVVKLATEFTILTCLRTSEVRGAC